MLENKFDSKEYLSRKKRKQIGATAKTKQRKILQEGSSKNQEHIHFYSKEEPRFEDEEDDYETMDLKKNYLYFEDC